MFYHFPLSALVILAAACASQPGPVAPAPLAEPQTITLTGTVTRDDFPSYLELPFTVPPGVERLTLSYDYEHKGDGVTLDLGLRDPDGLRGWSGSNKTDVMLSAWGATPSYRPGPIVPGEWTLILGVPNVREGRSSTYTATITLEPDLSGEAALAAASLRINAGSPGWLRGDFHAHTGHSDGGCALPGQLRAPCPTMASLGAAADAQLDFIAITEHNTLSHLYDLVALQPTTDIILIPGAEITTFEGHANVFGIVAPLDFQLGTTRLPGTDDLIDEVARRGALLSLNHPALPTGESCMGCGWSADTDFSRVEAIEVVNGSLVHRNAEEGAMSGIPFWEALLDKGHRITAIAGSDNHDPIDRAMSQPPIGNAATQVFVSERSTRGIVNGVRSGRAVVDLTGSPGSALDLVFEEDGRAIIMGGELSLADGQTATGVLNVRGIADGRIEAVASGAEVTLETDGPLADEAAILVTVVGAGGSGWFRFNVRDSESGRLLLLGNPIYVVSN